MHPVLLEWRGTRIYSHTVLLYLAAVAAFVFMRRMAEVAGLPAWPVLAATLLLLLAGLAGVRLLHAAHHARYYRRHPAALFRRSSGGAALLGGLAAMIAASTLVLPALSLDWLAYWDLLTPALCLGLGIAKFGCLLHGCCAGRITSGPIALKLPGRDGLWRPRYPSQLLESLAGMALFVTTLQLWYTLPQPGTVFFTGLLLYGLARMVLQPLREVQDRILGINTHGWIAGLMILSGATGYLAIH